jgi:hypothetical protein
VTMDLLICIDDTDDIDSRGTGEIAELLAGGLASRRLARCQRVTRHQLLVHPDIAYTSHNSAMCFPAQIRDEHLDGVTEWCQEALTAESAASSDPGLCIAPVEQLERPDELIAFGRDAKQRVLTKDEAYRVAKGLGVHLSEHGGTGIGVIGALAGAGLRLSGDDGRFKGKFRIHGDASGTARVAEILVQGVDSVSTPDGDELAVEERVFVGAECKLVLLGGRAVLLVAPTPPGSAAAWRVIERRALRGY